MKKCFICLFLVFLMTTPVCFAAGLGGLTGALKTGGKLGRTMTDALEAEKFIKRNVNDLIDEKPVPEIIRHLSEAPELSHVGPVDIAAVLYSRAIRKNRISGFERLSGQELENIKALMESLSVLSRGGPVKAVKIGDHEFRAPFHDAKMEIGDFEFEMKEVFSSPLFSLSNPSPSVSLGHVHLRVEEFVLVNLSDFTEWGSETLVRLWGQSERTLHRFLPEALEKRHLIDNPELVLKWFEEDVGHYGDMFAGSPRLIEDHFRWAPGVTEGFGSLNRLNGFIRSSLSSPNPEDIRFMETVFSASKENHGFSNYLDYLIKRIGKMAKIDRIKSVKPEDVSSEFGRRDIEEFTPADIEAFSPEQMGGFSRKQFEMFSDLQVLDIGPDQMKSIEAKNFPDSWLENLLPLDQLSARQVVNILMDENRPITAIMDMCGSVDNFDDLMRLEGLGPETRKFIEEVNARYRSEDSEAVFERMRRDYRTGVQLRRRGGVEPHWDDLA